MPQTLSKVKMARRIRAWRLNRQAQSPTKDLHWFLELAP